MQRQLEATQLSLTQIYCWCKEESRRKTTRRNLNNTIHCLEKYIRILKDIHAKKTGNGSGNRSASPSFTGPSQSEKSAEEDIEAELAKLQTEMDGEDSNTASQ